MLIENLKILLPAAEEQLLQLLINQCKKFATDYCNLSEYNEKLNDVVELMVVERFNKLSAEGISSRSYSSISESYTEDFSSVVYKGLQRYRKVRVI